MINGVLLIVAAVLFAVLYLLEGLGILWLWIAGFYLAAGILDLIFHVVKEKAKVHSANKKAAQAEKANKQIAQTKQTVEPKQEVIHD